MKNELVQLKAADYGLEETKAQEIQATFAPMLAKMTELEKEYNILVKENINEDVCIAARTLRLKYRDVRIGTAKIHKTLKDFYLKGGRFVDGWKNAQIMASQGMEDGLKKIENHYENLERDRIAKLQEERTEKLHKYEPEMNVPNLGEMQEDVWNNYIGGVKMQHDARIRAEKKAEKDRIKIEQAEIAERARIREENAKLKVEAEEREKQAKIEADKRAEKQQKEQEERDKIERLRLAKEKTEREKREAELLKERQERERLQNIERERHQQEEAELKAQEEEEKQAALAPDKEKLLNLAYQLNTIVFPNVESERANIILVNLRSDLSIVAEDIKKRCEKL